MTKLTYKRLKAIAGIIIAATAFALTLLVFTLLLGWPTSLPMLGVMLIVAWFVGTAVGGKLLPSRPSVVIPLILAIALTGSTLGFGVPWNLETGGDDSENVWFKMEASFTYRGSTDNLPIENVVTRFPCPNVDNVALPTYTTWSLYYQDNENVLHLEATDEQVYEFRGDRTATLGILLQGVEPTAHGPKLYFRLDKLYPREVFQAITLAQVSEENADKVTLRVYEDNEGRSSGAFYKHPSGPFDFPIDVSFLAQLSRKVDNTYETVETFSRAVDNFAWLTAWLYPS